MGVAVEPAGGSRWPEAAGWRGRLRTLVILAGMVYRSPHRLAGALGVSREAAGGQSYSPLSAGLVTPSRLAGPPSSSTPESLFCSPPNTRRRQWESHTSHGSLAVGSKAARADGAGSGASKAPILTGRWCARPPTGCRESRSCRSLVRSRRLSKAQGRSNLLQRVACCCHPATS